MRQAITTKWLGPTDHFGSRVKATARKRSRLGEQMALTDGWDHGSGVEENHCRVAKLLAARLGWSGLWVGGGSLDEDGFVFVCLPGSFSRQWVDRYIPGREGRDWFYVAPGPVNHASG